MLLDLDLHGGYLWTCHLFITPSHMNYSRRGMIGGTRDGMRG